MSSLSSDEKQAIREYIDYGVEKWGFNTMHSMQLALVFLGEKGGCLIGGSDSEDTEFIQSILDDVNAPYKKKGKRFYVAKSESHLSRYDPLGGDESVGKLFGYPEEAIEFYVKNSDRVSQWEEFIESTEYSDGRFSDEVWLIQYVPVPTRDGLERTIERQERFENALRRASVDFSDAHNFSL